MTGGGSGGGSLGAGGPITVNVTEEGPPPKLVTLAPGQSGGFYLLDNTVEVNGVGCTQVTSIDVTPPGGAGSLPLDVNLTVCGGAIGVYAVVPLASLGG